MRLHGGSVRLATVCCVAAALAAIGTPTRAADEARLPAPRTAQASAPGDNASLGSPDRRADLSATSFQPELPPDVDGLPAEIAPAVATPPPAPAGPPVGRTPLAHAGDEAPPDDIAPQIEAAIEATLAGDGEAAGAAGRKQRHARLAVGVFFFERAFAAFWTDGNGFTPRARAALARIDRAAEDGLDLSAIAIPAPGGVQWSAARRARAEVAVSQAVVAYAVQASGGRVEPAAISPEITARPGVADPLQALARVAAAEDAGAALGDLNPPQKGYRDLRDKLAQLRAEAAPATAIGADSRLTIRLVEPRARLVRAGYGVEAAAAGPGSNDRGDDLDVGTAVAGFPRARGLTPSAPSTAGALRALPGGAVGRQEAAILANMEMWRWEPREMGEERVEVNVPDFTLKLMRGDEVVHRARVIVGKPETQTAIFSNQIKYLLVNPAWVVPASIIRKEMMPKLAQDPDYLVKAGFEVTRKGDTLTVRQPPGERNALGHLLFMFPNEHSIYLHDTPSRGLFAAQRRAFSHGCVRVDDPMRLGELAMGGAQTGWTQARLRALEGGAERTIFLPHPLAIHIEYFTAFVDESGALQMRQDIYGHERRVEAALGLDGQA